MKTLDRYLIRHFMVNFAILFCVLVTLFVLIDMIIDLDEFLQASENTAKRWQAEANGVKSYGQGDVNDPKTSQLVRAFVYTVIGYYAPMVVTLYVYMCGLVVVGATGFSLAALVRAGELTAIVTSGVSMFRVAAPMLVVGCILNCIAMPLQELVIPKLAHKLSRSKKDLKKGEEFHQFAVTYEGDNQGNLFSAAEYLPLRGELWSVRIVQIDRTDHHFVRRIMANQAIWEPEQGGWKLIDAYALYPDTRLAGGASVPTVDFVESDLSPTVLMARRADRYPAVLSVGQLRQLINSKSLDARKARRMSMVLHSRFSMLIVNVLIQVLVLPFFLLREPASLMTQAAKAAGVCIGAWGMFLFGSQTGATLLPPVTAAWMPVFLYVPMSVFLIQTVKT